MEFNLNININNSFNKDKDSHKKADNVFNNESTLNNAKNITEAYSISNNSITGGYIDNSNNVVKNKWQKGFWRDVMVGIIVAILSTAISYFIFGMK